MKIRLITRGDVRQALSMERAIELMEVAFRSLSSGAVVAPVRTNVPHGSGAMLYKPVLMPSLSLFGLKAVSVFPTNASRGLPTTTGLMLVNDGETGLPLALIDAEYLTALRTGAASGLATRLFANPNAQSAALFGVGGQADCQLQALLTVTPLRTIHVFSRDPQRAKAFCERHASVYSNCRLIPGESRDVLKQCDVITTATSSASPVFGDDDVSPGVHINGIGSFTPDAAEVPPGVVCRATTFVDHREAALAEAGDLTQPLAAGLLSADFLPAEIGEVLSGVRQGRASAEEITFFKSVGNAAQDVVCAAEVLRIAEAQNLGQIADLAAEGDRG